MLELLNEDWYFTWEGAGVTRGEVTLTRSPVPYPSLDHNISKFTGNLKLFGLQKCTDQLRIDLLQCSIE
jgi:hypothetical protein